ncbi:tRNA glutamyl-Q(34) synthetase GluQRS [Rhodococcus sp. NBC_00294]|uniref:tRNA glutamyl-Q(34) synthetase GluQRS n=1 Tax=Rhodococcus sp. NBC_00294 TaxID=2976004 RepID=UPI002E298308|nr:tRNA glutamyl-Q(34) synthetase GluQRS [Rhodococcus sp. NBC_00294]
MNGRFAPSPSGDLHIGNLRTAVLAWLLARGTGRGFVLRVEDLDRVRPGAEHRQLDDLAAVGITVDGPVLRQSDRRESYAAAIASLAADGRVYECFCTRREIQQAASAPHAPEGAYPGTCRNLTEAQRASRRAEGRRAALRLRSDTRSFTVTDALVGEFTGVVDDLVLQRTDGVPAYNLAVVVDDGFQSVDQVVRADDLLASAPRQAYLAGLLGVQIPEYVHVPLALGPTGTRLAKRDGAVTLRDRLAAGQTVSDVRAEIASSIGVPSERTHESLSDLASHWSLDLLPREPWFVLGH